RMDDCMNLARKLLALLVSETRRCRVSTAAILEPLAFWRTPMTPGKIVCRFAYILLASSVAVATNQKQGPASGEKLRTGMSITPKAAPGSTIEPLNPDLPDRPEFTVDHPITTAISPDGNTLLILTSGFNRNLDAKGRGIPGQTSEYVFVYDIRRRPP